MAVHAAIVVGGDRGASAGVGERPPLTKVNSSRQTDLRYLVLALDELFGP
jgi:hypothetical protein